MLIPKGRNPGRMKQGRVKDGDHLAYVAGFPCCCCGVSPVEVHHLIGQYGPDGPVRGWSLKAGDNFTIPICPAHHRALHDDGNEIEFLDLYGVNGLEIAQELWRAYCEKKYPSTS